MQAKRCTIPNQTRNHSIRSHRMRLIIQSAQRISAQHENRILCPSDITLLYLDRVVCRADGDQSHFAGNKSGRLSAFRSRGTLIDKNGLNLKQFNMY